MSIAGIDYADVTEVPGSRVTEEGLSRAYSRYAFASRFAASKDVLEIACGAAFGLGYLLRTARSVIGGDLTHGLLRIARRHYASRIPFVRLDGHHLPFGTASFDLVILHEAIYYFADASAVFREARRVLRPGGVFLISTVNQAWPDFHPSPHATRYLAARQLDEELGRSGFDVELYGGFADVARGIRARAVSIVKRTAVRARLIPNTMRGREPLRRLFLGRLVPIPAEIFEGMTEYDEPRPLTQAANRRYKILYAVARVKSTGRAGLDAC